MEIFYLSDAIAVLVSVGMITGYHLLLRARVRADPRYTIQAMLNQARRLWVARILQQGETLLGVQTLRNLIMTATFYASTAVAANWHCNAGRTSRHAVLGLAGL